MQRFALLSFLVMLAGCPSEGRTPPPGTDAAMGMDSSMPDEDTGVPPEEDAGTPMEDAGPSCACPTLPATCTPPAAGSPTFAPDDGPFGQQLMDVIACADTTLHMSLYQTEWSCIPDAIAARLDADPDLEVSIVIDDDMCPRDGGGTLQCALAIVESHPRVTIVSDDRAALMHHKLVIADGTRAWVSSANMTEKSFCTDFNNSIVVEQAEIVAGLEEEFDRMFTMLSFSPIDRGGPVTGGGMSLYFSPETPASSPSPWFDAIVAAIEGATTSVDVMISAWTRTEISDALVAAHGRGVTVRAVVSHIYADDPPALALLAAGIEVRAANMHSKTMIIDGQTVITGSANWSMNAWSNSEISLWIDDAAVGAAYTAEMNEVFAGAEATP